MEGGPPHPNFISPETLLAAAGNGLGANNFGPASLNLGQAQYYQTLPTYTEFDLQQA